MKKIQGQLDLLKIERIQKISWSRGLVKSRQKNGRVATYYFVLCKKV